MTTDVRRDGAGVVSPEGSECLYCVKPGKFAVRQPDGRGVVCHFVCAECAMSGLESGTYTRVGRWGGVSPSVFVR